MEAINPSLLVVSLHADGDDPTAPVAIVLCPACSSFVPVSLVGARVQACEVCSSEVVVTRGERDELRGAPAMVES